MPILSNNPTLQDIQQYVLESEIERGFTKNTSIERALMLGEEVGELFKAIRKVEKMRLDPTSKVGDVGEEMADILIHLCSLANLYNINLETEFRNKEEKNKKRVWKVQ
jgi:NTP pyrophosphatase (non-canonical NTP hydrolase)